MPHKILIVDDSPIILKTLSMKLTANGYEVITADDGGSAVSLVRHERPDLVLLDICFPPDVGHGGGDSRGGFLVLGMLRRFGGKKRNSVFIIPGGGPAP